MDMHWIFQVLRKRKYPPLLLHSLNSLSLAKVKKVNSSFVNKKKKKRKISLLNLFRSPWWDEQHPSSHVTLSIIQVIVCKIQCKSIFKQKARHFTKTTNHQKFFSSQYTNKQEQKTPQHPLITTYPSLPSFVSH